LLSDLARSAGNHPLLRSYSVLQTEPRQSPDTTLDAYTLAWLQFLQNQLLDGVIYSDRYFHQQFLANMHHQVRNRLGQYLHQTVLAVPLDRRLPTAFDPNRFSDFIEQHVTQFGNSHLLTRTPRQLSSNVTPAPQAVRSLALDDHSSPTLDSLVIATIRQPGPCLLCRSSEHQFIPCLSFDALRQQPQLIAILSRALQKVSSSSTTKPPARQVRQLTAPVDLLDQAAPSSDDFFASTINEAGEGIPTAASIPTFTTGEGSPDISPVPSTPSPDFP
jgi:hypothetical protein